MKDTTAFLRRKFKGMERLVILGAGSVLRADDAAGVLITEALQADFPQEKYPELLLCLGETAPENFCGKIERFAPTHLLILDAADMGKAAGEILEIDPEDVGGPGFCTHMLPLKVMVDYLRAQADMDVTLLGIQPKTIAFDGPMSQEMRQSVKALTDTLRELIPEGLKGSPGHA